MMTIEEAIRHYEESEKLNKQVAGICVYPIAKNHNLENAEKCRQIIEWLRELQKRREQPEIIRCKDCKFSNKCDDDMSDIFESYGDEVYCSNHDIYLYKGWYCADAERRTDGQN